MNSNQGKSLLSLKQVNHINVLKNNVFEISKYPSFNLLIYGLEHILKNYDFSNKKICLLERTKLYGSSLFGGLFEKAELFSYDCSPSSADKRGNYNKFMINEKNFIPFKNIIELSQDEISFLPKEKFDIIFIPNLIHHFRDQIRLFSTSHKSLKNQGKLIIFEPTFREIHQYPHDYIRYTPVGLENMMDKYGFKDIFSKESGDSFEALTYILNVMKSKREDYQFNLWCDQIINNIEEFKTDKVDIVKEHAKFPTSFITFGTK